MKLCRFNIMNLVKLSAIVMFAFMLNIISFDVAYSNSTESEVFNALKVILEASKCSAAVYKAQYSGGCWACLVVEKMLSAFLNVANHALPITQKAGITLLVLGTILWLVNWALTNVSSFNMVKLEVILNSLFKMCFKVLLAYWFILYSTNAISQYFIRPIMSVGAVIGQNMWGEEIKATAVAWDDLSDIDITNDVNTSRQSQAKEIEEARKKAAGDDVNQEVLEELNARREKDEASKSAIPNFQMPGTNGRITSFPGCRVPPPTNNQSNCGSYSHMGLDISALSGSPIWAIAGGTIVYSQNSGWGNMAVVTTKHRGATWTHLYAHMNDKDWAKYKQYHASKGYKVARGEIIGGVGSTGQSSGPHLHVEVLVSGTVDGKTYNNDIVEPISLAEGKIVVRGKKKGGPTGAVDKSSCACGNSKNPVCEYHHSWIPMVKAQDVEKKKNKICRGFNSKDPETKLKKGSMLPKGGITSPGTVSEVITTAYIGEEYLDSGGTPVSTYYEPPAIPDIAYTGPTNIMPKSIMNSLLNAIRTITDTTADNLVLGRMIMCYSSLPYGGAWKIFGWWVTDLFTLLQGIIILAVGVILVIAIGYYFLDISFKIGFCVMALPIVVGLWPFKKFEKKVVTVLSILMKASASFAFMAIITSYGVALVSESVDDVTVLYEKIEQISLSSSDDERDALNAYIGETISFFSSTFLMLVFAMYYFYKLVSETTGKITDKFFKDATFGSKNPMQDGATAGTKYLVEKAKKYSGYNLMRDIAKTQAGNAVKLATGKVGGMVGAATGRGLSKLVNTVRRKK